MNNFVMAAARKRKKKVDPVPEETKDYEAEFSNVGCHRTEDGLYIRFSGLVLERLAEQAHKINTRALVVLIRKAP